MNQNEVKALINLLDDPDEEIYSHISEKIMSYGQDVIPFLENAWENSFDSLFQKRIELIIHNIQYYSVSRDIKKWAEDGGKELLDGILLITRYQYPDLDTTKIKEKIEQIKHDVWLELNANLTALEQVKVLNHIFFDIHGFSGNTSNFHAPQNSYINNVLETKKGNPLSLSILYSIVAQQLDIPIYGVNLPEHFILAYVERNILWKEKGTGYLSNVLFYINAFSKGTVFSKKEIDAFLKQLKLPAHPIYYEPCSNVDIVRRVLRNLISSFEKLGYPDKVNEVKELLTRIS